MVCSIGGTAQLGVGVPAVVFKSRKQNQMKLAAKFRDEEPVAPFRRREGLSLSPGNVALRMLTARVIAKTTHKSVAEVASERWQHDRLLIELVTRAASSPAMTSVAGWAAELAQKVVADTVECLGAVSAAGEVLGNCLVLTWDGHGAISVPTLLAAANNGSFVAEGAPIPVHQLNTSPVQLLPYKIGSISVLTREMIVSSNAEKLISDTLVRSAGLAADVALFDANPATAARPAGLRNGVAPLTASTNTDLYEAFIEDVSNLIASVSVVGGKGPYILVTGPGHVAGAQMRFLLEDPTVKIVASTAVGDDFLAIAPDAIAAAIDQPDIETADSAALVMDTVPGAMGGGAAAQSMFQNDSVAIKVRWPMSWARRSPTGVAWVTPVW